MHQRVKDEDNYTQLYFVTGIPEFRSYRGFVELEESKNYRKETRAKTNFKIASGNFTHGSESIKVKLSKDMPKILPTVARNALNADGAIVMDFAMPYSLLDTDKQNSCVVKKKEAVGTVLRGLHNVRETKIVYCKKCNS